MCSTREQTSIDSQNDAFRHEKLTPNDPIQSEEKGAAKSVYQHTHRILDHWSSNYDSNIQTLSSDGTVDPLYTAADPLYATKQFLCSGPSFIASNNVPVFSQIVSNENTGDFVKIELDENDLERREYSSERENASTQVSSGCFETRCQKHLTNISKIKIFQEQAPSDVGEGEPLRRSSICTELEDTSFTAEVGNIESTEEDQGSEASIQTSGNADIPPPSTYSSTSISCSMRDSVSKQSQKAISENINQNPQGVLAQNPMNPCGLSAEQEGVNEAEPITSFVSLHRREHVVVKEGGPSGKPLCPLEERLKKPKSSVSVLEYFLFVISINDCCCSYCYFVLMGNSNTCSFILQQLCLCCWFLLLKIKTHNAKVN